MMISKIDRRALLATYADKYRFLVETGTYQGETPLALHQFFDNIVTIELGHEQWKFSSERLKHYRNITCLLGDSAEKLPEALRLIQGPAVVWLDGHYSGPGTARGSIDTPVKAEILTLFADIQATGRKHVILIDDARLFRGGAEHTEEFADYPSLSWVKRAAEEHGYRYELNDDIIRLTP